MKRFPSLGVFLLNSALIGAIARSTRGGPIVFIDRPVRMPDFQPRTLPHAEAKAYLSPKQADTDALDRAEAKRARKAAKLREHGL